MPKAKANKSQSAKHASSVKRASSDERQDRFRDIDTLFDKGHKPADIARAVCQRYGISRRQAERDIQQVKDRRQQYLNFNATDALRSEHYHQLKHLYQYCLQKEDISNALKVLAQQETLLDKISPTGAKLDAILPSSASLSASELAELVSALEGNRQTG